MPLTRKEYWDTRFFDPFIRERHKMPFEWGTNDCCIHAADAILAITGVDVADDFRGRYSDQAGAFELVKSLTGGATVADAAAYCATKHGLAEWKSPLQAQRGDLVVLNNAGQLIAGVVDLTGRFALSVSEAGLVRLALSYVTRAWKV